MSVIRLSSQGEGTRQFVHELLSLAKPSSRGIEERIFSQKSIRSADLEASGIDAFVVAEIARHDSGESKLVLSESEARFGLGLFADKPLQMRALLLERGPAFKPYVKRLIFGNLADEIRDADFDEYDLKAVRFDTGLSLDEFLALGFTVTDLEGLHFTAENVGPGLKAARRSLVAVFTRNRAGANENGSGVIVSSEGHVALAAHEVLDSYGTLYPTIEIACSGKLFKIGTEELVYDAKRDLAVVRCDALKKLIASGDAGVMRLANGVPAYGTATVAVGFPHSDDNKTALQPSYHDRRCLYEVGEYLGLERRDAFDHTLVQATSARLYSGSSGGALLSGDGEMFAIVTGILRSNKTGQILSSQAASFFPVAGSDSALDRVLRRIHELRN